MEALGINFINMVIYSVMFGILYYVIKTKLVPKLDDALSTRQKEIEKSLTLSKKAEETLKKIEEDQEKMMKKLHIEHKQKMESILIKANSEAKEIIDEAKVKSKNLIKSGEKLIDDERKKLDKELENKIALMAKKGLIWTKK